MYPQDLRYTSEHEWVRRTGPTTLRCGITPFAAESLGDVVHIELPEPGTTITAGQPCGELESTKSVADLFAPIDAQVEAANADLAGAPDLVNSDPFGDGWILDLSCPGAEELDAAWAGLLSAEQYSQQIG